MQLPEIKDANMSGQPDRFTFWHGLFTVEFIAVLIGLATTIVPGKTGSRNAIAKYFLEDPTFLQAFLVNVLVVHVILLLIAVVIGCWVWWDRRKATHSEN